MKNAMRMLAPVLLAFIFVIPGTPFLNAQITNTIQAHINHSFVIGNTTLPPGEYTFRMLQGTDLQAMTATSENDKTSVSFDVETAIDDHTPRHSELIFRRYGNTEFLSKIFESGSKDGAEVTETSRDEKHFAQQGLQPIEHTEEQK
ncbi:MAG TPA: hypothetical protein VMX38_12075 [Verrucomicrobiae bacterium]|nr:hypothetical protein [Verrucomicrobiae bacterium]